MYKKDLIKEMVETFPERRDTNSKIPKEAILVLAVLAKLQKLCAITDVPVATRDIDILENLGIELKVDKEDFMSEGAIRAFVNKYKAEEIIEFYNEIAKKIIKKMDYKKENNKPG